MKFKKYKHFKKKEISFIKFFYICYKKNMKIFKKYKHLWEFELQDIMYFDAYSDCKGKDFFKRVKNYNHLKKIIENKNEEDKKFLIYSNKKTHWVASHYDETSMGYDGDPYGTSGLKISYVYKHKKNKNLKIILFDWN